MFIMKFTSRFVKKASNWLLEQEQPIKCSIYKPVCETHYELLNFTTNLRTSELISEHLREKLTEIDCNRPTSVLTIFSLFYDVQGIKLDEFIKFNADIFTMSPPCQPFTRCVLAH